MLIPLLLLLTADIDLTLALNNGFTTPAMGYSTWNDCSSMRDNGPQGWCWNSEDHVKNVTLYFKSSGLFHLGYNRINIDEGWLKGRYTNGSLYEDVEKFPSGMKGLGDWIKSQGFHYGLYTCRGTCQCSTGTYSATGSYGYEKEDVDWMVQAGADYLKVDSCCGSQDHATAFSDYAKFRDAMNATGKQVWFSLCGWESWYAPVGASLGNSWRIAGDGSGWAPLTNCMNVQASVATYSGLGGWNDPDLLIGPKVYVGGQTDAQARAQFSMWCLFPANLLISQNVLQWTDYALETYSNAEAIAINQDSLGSPAQRVAGTDLTYPCSPSPSQPCTNIWGRRLSNNRYAMGFVNNGNSPTNITCDASCFAKFLSSSSSPKSVTIRDVWSHADVAKLTEPFTFTAPVDGSGFAALFTIVPN